MFMYRRVPFFFVFIFFLNYAGRVACMLSRNTVSPSRRLSSTDPASSEEIHCESLQTRLGQSTISDETVSTRDPSNGDRLRRRAPSTVPTLYAGGADAGVDAVYRT